MDKSLKQILKEILRAGGQRDDAIKNKATTLANHILMLIYLLNRLSVHLENEHMKRLLAMEKKKGARKIELDKQMEEWVNQRGRVSSFLILFGKIAKLLQSEGPLEKKTFL